METIIISIATVIFWLAVKAYMLSEERNKKEQDELNKLKN